MTTPPPPPPHDPDRSGAPYPPPGGGYQPPGSPYPAPGGGFPPAYPAQGGGYPGYPGHVGQFRPLDALDHAWKGFRREWRSFLGLTVVMFVVIIGIELALNLVTSGNLLGPEVDPVTGAPVMSWSDVVVDLGATLLSVVVQFVFTAALVRGALDMVDTGRTGVGEMFTRIPWLHLVLASVLVAVATMVGLVLCIIPGVVVAFLLVLTQTAVVDGHSGTDALVASFRVVKANVGEVLLVLLIFLGLAILALCTLGIGFLVLTPMYYIALAYTWRVLQGRPVASLAAHSH